MIELKDELFNAPIEMKWYRVPYMVNHHKWVLLWCRSGDREYCFSFVSPANQWYTYYTEGGIVIGADAAGADGAIAWYHKGWGDKLDKLDAVLRLTPTHIIDRLFALLDTIKDRFDKLRKMHDLFVKYAPADADLLDYIERHDEYIVLYRDDANACTPYIIHHLTDSGLYFGHYYDDGWAAYRAFHAMR